MVLQKIRDRLTGIIAIFIFGILIIPFAFVGVSSYFQSDAVNAVAVVNDQEITISEFNTEFQDFRRRMQAQMGQNFDAEYFDQAIVRREFLERMIDEELVAQVSNEAGLAVDDQVLAERIRNTERFQVDGEFNPDVYQSILTAQGMTPKQYERQMRNSMILSQFPQAIGNSSISTNWELRDYARLMDQKRTFKALIVPGEPAVAEGEENAEPPAVDEAEIQAWYDAHLNEYQSEEMVSVDYLELNAANMGDSVEPSEDDLMARFEEQKNRFITPESRLASHILIEVEPNASELDIESARQQAEELAERARGGEDFAELAREYSQDVGSAEAGGDLGWVEPGFMVKAFEDGLYALTTENPVSDPVQTGFGWHVILLRDIRPAEGMSYTEARDTLLAEYEAEAAERQFLEAADRLVDIIYEDPTTLEAAASELGLEVQTVGPFGREGGAEGLAANMNVVNAAFSDLVLGQNVASDPIDLGDNHIVIIHLKEHFPQAQLPLADVRDQVVAEIRKQRAREAASERAASLVASIETGESIESLADSTGLQLVDADAVTRYQTGFDPALMAKVFLMPEPGDGGPVTETIELADDYAVVQLDSVIPGELSDEDALRKDAYQRRISTSSANTEVLGFVQMLRKQSEITVYEDRL
jgi:peptidyl-prolyl cis-trans isomerase D